MSDKPPAIDTTQILADAEITATYFRAMLDKGVPVQAAVQMATSYVSSIIFARKSGEEPKKPWEP